MNFEQISAIHVAFIAIIVSIAAITALLLHCFRFKKKVYGLIDDIQNSTVKKPTRISDDMYVANILRQEHGKVFFNARMYVSKYNIDIRSKDFDMMQIFDKFDIIDIRPMSYAEMLHVLISGNKVKIDAMLISASYTNVGVPWIVDYKGKYYTDEVITLCLSYLNMMAFVSAKSLYEHKINRQNADQFRERRKLSRKEFLDCVHVSDELVNWFISFDVPGNILVMFKLFINDASLYDVRKTLAHSRV